MSCPITAVFPAHRRVEPALHLLGVLGQCDPKPAEIIVHVDGGDPALIEALQRSCPEVVLLSSRELLGPGGSRNRLIAAAKHELVANFDDDSFPENPRYFRRVLETAERFPEAAALSAASQESEWHRPDFLSVSCFSGCGCVFRKSWFEKTAGFVPLPIAYNMEEVDVGLQLHALGGIVVQDPRLRVTHHHPPSGPASLESQAAVMANSLLLPYLRYPKWLWPVGLWHLISWLRSAVRFESFDTIARSLQLVPGYLRRHRQYRRVMPTHAVLSWLRLRRRPKSLGPAD